MIWILDENELENDLDLIAQKNRKSFHKSF